MNILKKHFFITTISFTFLLSLIPHIIFGMSTDFQVTKYDLSSESGRGPLARNITYIVNEDATHAGISQLNPSAPKVPLFQPYVPRAEFSFHGRVDQGIARVPFVLHLSSASRCFLPSPIQERLHQIEGEPLQLRIAAVVQTLPWNFSTAISFAPQYATFPNSPATGATSLSRCMRIGVFGNSAIPQVGEIPMDSFKDLTIGLVPQTLGDATSVLLLTAEQKLLAYHLTHDTPQNTIWTYVEDHDGTIRTAYVTYHIFASQDQADKIQQHLDSLVPGAAHGSTTRVSADRFARDLTPLLEYFSPRPTFLQTALYPSCSLTYYNYDRHAHPHGNVVYVLNEFLAPASHKGLSQISKDYGVRYPKLPMFHPYDFIDAQSRVNEGVPHALFILHLPPNEEMFPLPGRIQERLRQIRSEPLQLHLSVVAQNLPWASDVPVLLRPHYGMFPDAPTSGTLDIQRCIHVGITDSDAGDLSVDNTPVNTFKDETVHIHPDSRSLLILSGNILGVNHIIGASPQGIWKSYTSPQSLWSYVEDHDGTTRHAFVTLHWLVNDAQSDLIQSAFSTLLGIRLRDTDVTASQALYKASISELFRNLSTDSVFTHFGGFAKLDPLLSRL